MTAAAHPLIEAFKRVNSNPREIYCYSTPGVTYHEGWVKLGESIQGADVRIGQQTRTADIDTVTHWVVKAEYTTAPYIQFSDKDFHRYLEHELEIERKYDENGKPTEWFKITPEDAQTAIWKFKDRKSKIQGSIYIPRQEQFDCRVATQSYFAEHGNGSDFMWDCKTRFGKTSTFYDLVVHMNTRRQYLVLTNRPAVSDGWLQDYIKFVQWVHPELCFVSDAPIMRGAVGCLTWDDYQNGPAQKGHGCLIFDSLQNVKGSVYFGGSFDKLKHLTEIEFDIFAIDEAHEGISTDKADFALAKIKRKHLLYMTGTGFKLLASDKFNENQIFSWSYVDEQKRKREWKLDPERANMPNPYASLPTYKMLTYQLSRMIYTEMENMRAELDDGASSFAFNLNEFFETNANGVFVHEKEVDKFLDLLTSNEKYPFGTPKLREELRHTVWYLNRVASAKALARKLAKHPVFKDYRVIVAAGDGRVGDETVDDKIREEKALTRVRNAIENNDNTITLTVGQLTTGITIPEWSGILMLCNLMSPQLYFQAIARVQNGYEKEFGDGTVLRKMFAYVFDFDPARTLTLFDVYSNDLSYEMVRGSASEVLRAKNIKEMLNFFPVIGEDEQGQMVELDAEKVLSVPRKIKSEEVVRHGFMSSFLFSNMTNVFGASSYVTDILMKMKPCGEPVSRESNMLDLLENISLDEEGNPKTPEEAVERGAQEILSDPEYVALEEDFQDVIDEIEDEEDEEITDPWAEIIERAIPYFKETASKQGVGKAASRKIAKTMAGHYDEKARHMRMEYDNRKALAKMTYENAVKNAQTFLDEEEAEKVLNEELSQLDADRTKQVKELASEIHGETPTELARQIEKIKADDQKNTVEESVRAHLRGFARSMPSLLMAFGDRDLRLSNLETYMSPEVFEETTGITVGDFEFLRDGGVYVEDDCSVSTFEGHLFDEAVFDDSVQVFLDKKQELGKWYKDDQDEDIFDFIPPQRTNQIYTPRRVVNLQLDCLESDKPGCFDTTTDTFCDPYMKSGLYIVETVKRIVASPSMKAMFDNDKERVDYVLDNLVYGIAPSKVIYAIALEFIFGYDEARLEEARTAAKAGKPYGNFACVEGIEEMCQNSGELADMCWELWGDKMNERD